MTVKKMVAQHATIGPRKRTTVGRHTTVVNTRGSREHLGQHEDNTMKKEQQKQFEHDDQPGSGSPAASQLSSCSAIVTGIFVDGTPVRDLSRIGFRAASSDRAAFTNKSRPGTSTSTSAVKGGFRSKWAQILEVIENEEVVNWGKNNEAPPSDLHDGTSSFCSTEQAELTFDNSEVSFYFEIGILTPPEGCDFIAAAHDQEASNGSHFSGSAQKGSSFSFTPTRPAIATPFGSLEVRLDRASDHAFHLLKLRSGVELFDDPRGGHLPTTSSTEESSSSFAAFLPPELRNVFHDRDLEVEMLISVNKASPKTTSLDPRAAPAPEHDSLVDAEALLRFEAYQQYVANSLQLCEAGGGASLDHGAASSHHHDSALWSTSTTPPSMRNFFLVQKEPFERIIALLKQKEQLLFTKLKESELELAMRAAGQEKKMEALLKRFSDLLRNHSFGTPSGSANGSPVEQQQILDILAKDALQQSSTRTDSTLNGDGQEHRTAGVDSCAVQAVKKSQNLLTSDTDSKIRQRQVSDTDWKIAWNQLFLTAALQGKRVALEDADFTARHAAWMRSRIATERQRLLARHKARLVENEEQIRVLSRRISEAEAAGAAAEGTSSTTTQHDDVFIAGNKEESISNEFVDNVSTLEAVLQRLNEEFTKNEKRLELGMVENQGLCSEEEKWKTQLQEAQKLRKSKEEEWEALMHVGATDGKNQRDGVVGTTLLDTTGTTPQPHINLPPISVQLCKNLKEHTKHLQEERKQQDGILAKIEDAETSLRTELARVKRNSLDGEKRAEGARRSVERMERLKGLAATLEAENARLSEVVGEKVRAFGQAFENMQRDDSDHLQWDVEHEDVAATGTAGALTKSHTTQTEQPSQIKNRQQTTEKQVRQLELKQSLLLEKSQDLQAKLDEDVTEIPTTLLEDNFLHEEEDANQATTAARGTSSAQVGHLPASVASRNALRKEAHAFAYQASHNLQELQKYSGKYHAAVLRKEEEIFAGLREQVLQSDVAIWHFRERIRKLNLLSSCTSNGEAGSSFTSPGNGNYVSKKSGSPGFFAGPAAPVVVPNDPTDLLLFQHCQHAPPLCSFHRLARGKYLFGARLHVQAYLVSVGTTTSTGSSSSATHNANTSTASSTGINTKAAQTGPRDRWSTAEQEQSAMFHQTSIKKEFSASADRLRLKVGKNATFAFSQFVQAFDEMEFKFLLREMKTINRRS